MSEVRVNDIVDYGGKGAPTFDNGAVISGITTSDHAVVGSNVTLTSGGVNVSGVTTAVELSGNLTGDINSGFVTATSAIIGSGVTINASGFNVTGIISATSYVGDGSSLTGAAVSIAPLTYNPDVNDTQVTKATGIGITFDHRLIAGSGNITLSVSNAGAAGTTVENFGVGSSVTIAGRNASITPSSDLNQGETYHISYPSGAFTNTSGDVDYVGTAYTFGVEVLNYSLFNTGNNEQGQLGQNNTVKYSSPVQIPGLWSNFDKGQSNTTDAGGQSVLAIKNGGTLWSWGYNPNGQLGVNNTTTYSSPVQVPGTTWSKIGGVSTIGAATKTDGTLWVWGTNAQGQLGQNDRTQRSSPVQIPGSTWSSITVDMNSSMALRTDGTLWSWGYNSVGQSAQNDRAHISSPTQIPGTTWSRVACGYNTTLAIKTDGTLWGWGSGNNGILAQNNETQYSSPVQVPGTTWSKACISERNGAGIKTDGTLWTWGRDDYGELGVNTAEAHRSSPIQVPGTTWVEIAHNARQMVAIKTDGTVWVWGDNDDGQLAQNDRSPARYSSPTQIPGQSNVKFGDSSREKITWFIEV